MNSPLLTAIVIASMASFGVTAAFSLAVRTLWRRGKSLREP
ncbi:MAG: hypothetical protein ACTHPS_03365 [Streptosporangiaceae bacterium]